MTGRQITCGVVAVLLGTLALLPILDQSWAEAPGALSVLSAAEDSGGVLITLDVAPIDSSVTGDCYLEFEFDPPETDEVIRIEAWLVTADEQPAELAVPSEPISIWEITPADRAVGLGGYVRLYLPSSLQGKRELDGPLVVRIVSAALSGEVLKAGVESLAATPATAE